MSAGLTYGMNEENTSTMGWNPPSQGPQGPQDNRPNSSDREPRNSGGNDNDDPWQRQRQRNSANGNDDGNGNGVNSFFKKAEDLWNKKGNMGGMGGNTFKRKGSLKTLLIGLVVVLLGVFIFTGFYTVREAERAVVLRFGKFYEVVEPGLQWKIPGIDQAYTVDIEQVRSIQSSGAMLTEDENVVIVEMDVQYRISDPFQYLFSVTNPDNSLMEATDSALRYVVGHTMMDDILTSGREMVRQGTRELLISIIEPYKMGLSIVDVNFLPARAPDEVKEAFDDAIAAQEDEQRFKREAEAYANEVLPRAEGQVQRIRQEAEAYRSQVVLDAQGEVARFEQVLPEYNAAPEITRMRLYLETMQEVLGSSSKIILDTPEGSSPVLYLPMPTNTGDTNKGKVKSNSVSTTPRSGYTTSSSSVPSSPYYGASTSSSTTSTAANSSSTRSTSTRPVYGYGQSGR